MDAWRFHNSLRSLREQGVCGRFAEFTLLLCKCSQVLPHRRDPRLQRAETGIPSFLLHGASSRIVLPSLHSPFRVCHTLSNVSLPRIQSQADISARWLVPIYHASLYTVQHAFHESGDEHTTIDQCLLCLRAFEALWCCAPDVIS